jgi:hypothetical protein
MNQTFCTVALQTVSDDKGISLTYKQDPPYQAEQNLQIGPCISPTQVLHAERQSSHLTSQAQDHT